MPPAVRLAALCLSGTIAAATAPVTACPLADRLIADYGISFSGFDKPIARVAVPAEKTAPSTILLTLDLPNKNGDVPDGFHHLALINTVEKRAWILRTGGFLYVREWYGPVALAVADTDGCVMHGWVGPIR